MIDRHSYEQVHLKVEPKSFIYEFLNSRDPLYGKSQTRGHWNNRNLFRGDFRGGHYKSNESRTSARRKNPLDSSGNVSRCSICESICHWKQDCPDAYENRQKDDSKVNLAIAEES